ncbi:MAG: hypothetical protein M0R38_09835 [Bacteroidia bacterium]|nr:hypothetical protein [Bacteroidia bacterium]
MRKIFFYILLLQLHFSSTAQSGREFSNWIFADNNTFYFPDTASDPVVSNNPTLNIVNSTYGLNDYPITTCVSDSNGNLQFYTAKGTIWNKNFRLMQGSELIDSLSMFPFAIKRPNRSHYCISSKYAIDMDIDSGRGGVVEDNRCFTVTFSDYINHPSKRFVWLLESRVSQFDSTLYIYAYKFTQNGIDSNDVIISKALKFPHKITINSSIVNIRLARACKISPDGKYLIVHGIDVYNSLTDDFGNLWNDRRILLLDFDIETGIAHNPRQIKVPFHQGYYNQPHVSGIEFSRSYNYFYLSLNYYAHPDLGLYQCPVTIVNDTLLTNACHKVIGNGMHSITNLRLAYNKKIYLSRDTYMQSGILQ